jgi:hypothetical protein
MTSRFPMTLAMMAILLCGGLFQGGAAGQVVDNPGFKALPRPIHYATPLAPKEGAKAVIVYGKDSPWTLAAAQAVQKAIEDWSGVKLELADDRTVTSEETWLVNDAYRKTPLVVLGNARDNRVMHAMGTQFLLQSNRAWPGGDRFVIRTVFEPFVADVNYVVLEASSAAGMDGAVGKFTELLKTFDDKSKSSATIPPALHVVGSVKDKYEKGWMWHLPPEWIAKPDASVAELIQAFKGQPMLAGTAALNEGIPGSLSNEMLGGGMTGDGAWASNLLPAQKRASIAMTLLGCRAQGGRTHGNYDHYGALGSFVGIRAGFQTGILTPEELNEFESCIVLSTAAPLDYVYNNFGGDVDTPGGNRHFSACMVTTANTAEYVLSHCRLDERTGNEIRRRYNELRKSMARFAQSYRDHDDSDQAGEDTLMHVSAFLGQGMMEYVRNGNLRKAADWWLLTVDNMPGFWGGSGNYIGLSGFSSGPGGIMFPAYGGGLLEEVAFYYDDPQARWLAAHWSEAKGSRGGGYLPMFTDTVSAMTKPVVPDTYDGVRAMHFDRRLYDLLQNPERIARREEEQVRLAPESYEKALDRLAFRDDFDTQAAYMSLLGSSSSRAVKPLQNNMIARYTDLADVWLFTNVNDNSAWVRNVVSISNGKGYVPRTGCSLEALANLGEVSAAASREPGVAGSDWTRTIVHWRGHYFVVIDRMEALGEASPASQGSAEASDFAFVCRWRCPQLAGLQNGVWTAVAPTGNKMVIQNTQPLFQTSEFWEMDGAARPYVLQQYKHAKLAKGQSQTYQNLIYVSGARRPEQFEARQVTAQAMLVRGHTAAGDHLALIGVHGQMPLADFETDAAIYDVVGNTLHLAGATTLKARLGTEMREIFWSTKPVNLLLDCATGSGQIEVGGDAAVQVKTGQTWAARSPGRTSVTLAEAGAIPKPAATVEALWARSKAPSAGAPDESAAATDVFDAKVSDAPLQRPLRLLTNADISSTPKANEHRRTMWMWNNTDNLEITLSLPEPETIGCLRLAAANKPPPTVVGRNPTGGEWVGTPGAYYEQGDMKFSLVLSDDGFKNDLRKIDEPKVTFEYTSYPPADHTTMQHFGTWRIEVAQKARQVKVLPRATTRERAKLDLREIQLYAAQRVDELAVKVSAADMDGDGSNELVVGTSEKQFAAYDAQGRQLWIKNYPGDILRMDTADLDGDGKAEAIAYLMTEALHRVNADGSERPGGDVLAAEREVNHGCWGVAGAAAMGIWAPQGATKKEVLLFSEGPYHVAADGSVKPVGAAMGQPLGFGRLVNLFPNEPEVLATVQGRGVDLWSTRRDKNGLYTHLGGKPQVSGPDGGQLAWVQQVDVAGLKGFLAAAHNGVNYYPIAAFEPNNKAQGWEFASGGMPAVAAVLADIKGDGVPQVFMARLDGFVNVLKLADGSAAGVLNAGEPILGLAVLKGKDGKNCLAVGTRFGVHLFGADPSGAGFKEIGAHRLSTPAAGFAGPGGKDKNSVYVVDMAGNVIVLTVK